MKKQSLADTILEGLWEAGGAMLFLLPRPFESKYAWARRLRTAEPDSYTHAVRRLQRKGYLEVIKKNNEKFLQITQAGEMEILMRKAGVVPTEDWDGKWRLCMFDIPEESKEKRALMRKLLKKNNFVKLQNSVYVTPYSLNAEAVDYLKQTGLTSYVRIMRVDNMDDDSQFRKKFGLLK